MRVLVYVLNMRGQPIMPTSPRKARKLLELNKAEVVTHHPFTIKLKYPSGETKQNIILGIDPGYKNAGFSAVSGKQELFAGELSIRDDISKRIQQKKMYRNNRRRRKRYRKIRFNNRKRKEGWLPPSLNARLDVQLRMVQKIYMFLPVNKIVVEVAQFNLSKLATAPIQRMNLREYLLHKYNRKCAYCNKTSKTLEIEHIVPKSKGGSDRIENLTLACRKCNLNKGNKIITLTKSNKAPPFMNSVYNRFAKSINANTTYGYITKSNRTQLKLSKSHINDAFIIAGGSTQIRTKPLHITQRRRNNRSIQINRKGKPPSVRRKRYNIQPGDIIQFQQIICIAKGVYNNGKRVKFTINNKTKTTNTENIKLVKYGKGFIFTRELN